MVDTCWLKKEGSFKDELAPDSGPRPSTSQQTLKWCKNVGCRLILLDCLMRQMTQESPSLIGLSKSLDTHLPLSRKCHPIFEQLYNIMQHFCINHSDLSFLHYPVWQFLSFTVLFSVINVPKKPLCPGSFHQPKPCLSSCFCSLPSVWFVWLNSEWSCCQMIFKNVCFSKTTRMNAKVILTRYFIIIVPIYPPNMPALHVQNDPWKQSKSFWQRKKMSICHVQHQNDNDKVCSITSYIAC